MKFESDNRWGFSALLLLMTVLVFWPCVHNGFVSWDDDKNFLTNFHYRGFSPANLRWMFSEYHLGLYIPMTWLTLAGDYVLWGMNPFGYHLSSLLLHAIGVVLFFVLADELYLSARPDSDSGTRRWAAACAAALFGIHPLRVESVAWITERRDVLSGIFFFATLLCYVRYGRSHEGPACRRRWLALAVAAFCLSLLSKPNALALPLVLILLDIYPLCRWEKRSAKIEKIPFFILSFIFGWAAVHGQMKAGASAPWELYHATQRLALMCYGDLFYVWKTLWPYHLSPFYRLPAHVGLADAQFFWRELTVLGLSLFFIANYRRRPAGLVLWVAYLALLSPTSGLFQSGPQIVADRYSYLCCVGWALLGGSVLLGPWKGLAVPMVLVLVWLGILTRKQISVWRDSESLWSFVLKRDPENSFAHNNLGEDLRMRGRFPEAIRHIQAALRLQPTPEMHYNLALALNDSGKTDEALEEFTRTIAQKPDFADAHYNLGMLYLNRGSADKALREFQETIDINPEYGRAHNTLGALLLSRGRAKESEEQFREAVALMPEDADGYNNLGSALAFQGRLLEAVRQFEKALALNPHHSLAAKNLAAAQSQRQAQSHP